MNIRQLRYFIAVAEAGSFSRAAERIHIAQPALSQHVLAMEAEFGMLLLQRNPRGVVLTEAGLRLLQRARELDYQFSGLNDYVRGAAVPSGEVRFGMPGTINEQLGVPLIEAGRERYPDVRIRISEAMSGYVLGWLREGSVDLAMLYNVADEKGLKLHHALTEEIRLFGLPNMKSAPKPGTVTLTAALGLPLILPGPTHGLRDLIDAAAKSIGKRPAPTIEIDSYRQIKQLAARGFAFALLPATAIKQEINDGVFQSWKVTRPALMRRIFLGYQAGRPLSLAGRAVAQLSWRILEDCVRTGGWAASWGNGEALNLYPRL
jgi:LysR family transcriptional regulator, nitrogen assimilation regulatory protein